MISRIKYLINSGEAGINWMAIGPLLFFFVLLIAIFVVTAMRSKSMDAYDANLPLEDGEIEENNF